MRLAWSLKKYNSSILSNEKNRETIKRTPSPTSLPRSVYADKLAFNKHIFKKEIFFKNIIVINIS